VEINSRRARISSPRPIMGVINFSRDRIHEIVGECRSRAKIAKVSIHKNEPL
jgi:hypothetical protein